MLVAVFVFCVVGLTLAATTKEEKLKRWLDNFRSSDYGEALPTWENRGLSGVTSLFSFGTEDISLTFDHVDDVMPQGRKKFIHPLGSTAAVRFIMTQNHPYTGMFAGGDACLVRLSLAANPDSLGFVPGMALKCFTDGSHPSANFISMFALDGQGENYNFFANTFTNIVQEPKSTALKVIETTIFNRASSCSVWLSLKQFASVAQDGSTGSPRWPQKIYLVPTREVQFDEQPKREFRYDLMSIPAGTTLWTVYAEDVHGSGDRSEIGVIQTTSNFHSSSVGDDYLFFQHDRGEEDRCGKSNVPIELKDI